MSEILVLGSLNMDLVANVKKMPRIGETIVGDQFSQIPGGKGGNQVCAMARLGASVSMIGCVGEDDFGKVLKASLKNDGADVSSVKSVDGVSTGIAMIMVDERADNSIVVIPGANYSVDQRLIDENEKLIDDCKIAVSQLEVPLEVVEHFIVNSKKRGKYTILNPAPAKHLSDELIKHIDLLTPNETELETISGCKVSTIEEAKIAAKVLIDKGLKEVLVTLGEAGSLYINKDRIKHFPTFKVKAIDTTAAGDSFTAAIAVGKSEDMKLDDAIVFASKVGALTVTKKGAQSSLPSREEVNNFRGE
ncbi:ribokinase [Lutibacter sp. B2]|nr:ribokinase [Lutibacter sp. B2]